jgi:N,N'-diacetyl-8-epilegionaminate cytidylyltransferase
MLSNGYTLGAIFARGGSKGVPRKNIRPLAGKPLIAYAIETALASQYIDRLIVSTDDPEIADVAKRYGAEVPFMRPSELAQDNSPEWLSWQHAIRTVEARGAKVGCFVCIPPTSPLRSVEDVDACILKLTNTDADIVVTATPARRSPHFNMVTIGTDDTANLVISPKQNLHHRQAVPLVYDMTTIAYAANPEFVLNNSALFVGNVKAVVVPDERALDIDSELDFMFAEFLMEKNG